MSPAPKVQFHMAFSTYPEGTICPMDINILVLKQKSFDMQQTTEFQRNAMLVSTMAKGYLFQST